MILHVTRIYGDSDSSQSPVSVPRSSIIWYQAYYTHGAHRGTTLHLLDGQAINLVDTVETVSCLLQKSDTISYRVDRLENAVDQLAAANLRRTDEIDRMSEANSQKGTADAQPESLQVDPPSRPDS